MKHIHFESIDSTNLYLKNNYSTLDHDQLVTSDHQTEGKGRMGNTWSDTHGSALFSILLKKDLHVSKISQIPILAVVAAHKVLLKYVPSLMIKWPNDLLVHEKKLVGILSESIIIGNNVEALIVGFGINVQNEQFNSTLDSSATSIFLETGLLPSIGTVIQDVSHQFTIEFDLMSNRSKEYLNYYKKYLLFLGQEITYVSNGIKYHAIAVDINSEGNLIVRNSSGKMTLKSSEVHLIRTY